MDIEGAEPIALAGFDIERFRPELVGIEVFPQNEEKILEYFGAHGYRRLDEYLERHSERLVLYLPAAERLPGRCGLARDSHPSSKRAAA